MIDSERVVFIVRSSWLRGTDGTDVTLIDLFCSALVGLDELKRRKRSVEISIEAKERDVDALRRRLKELEGFIARDRETLGDYDKLVREAEQSLDRILESSEFLLNAIRRETQNLDAREP